MKNNTTLSIAIASFLLIGLNARAQKTDFSESWILNKESSEFGDISPNSAAISLKVVQDKDRITIERRQKTAAGELDYTENLTFDSKPAETSIKEGIKRTSSAKWSADGKTLTEQSTYSNGQKSTETWAILTDGDGQLLVRKEVELDGDVHSVQYLYDKQK
ncbi:MAG TPA: hypothetical protein VK671_05530 [Mucilaginibacter sp.]|jgi:hypothetical protein|nr:hypothetical protein [Mucilaginibacter sp.]